MERDHIRRVLELCGWRVRGAGNAALHLGLNASTLYSRMKKRGVRAAPAAVEMPAAAGPLDLLVPRRYDTSADTGNKWGVKFLGLLLPR